MERLLEAAERGNIDELKDLISSNKQILKKIALEGAGHTPLHVACVAGCLDVVRELLKLMPKLVEKVDADGFSPLHIAAAQGEVEIARELLAVGPHLCSVKGWERRIPLHYAITNGELDVMKLLLSASPESIEEKTAREETALHLAVKNNRFEVLVKLVEHLKRYKKEHVINLKDRKGNTALHLAAAGKNFEVVDFLLHGHALEYEVVKLNDLNESGLTPLDVSTPSQRGARDREIREILVRAGAKHGASRPVSGDDDDVEAGNDHQLDGELVSNAPQPLSPSTLKKSNNDGGELGWIQEALLVVAGLIANATYQSVLQPPSVVQDNKADNTSGGSKDSASPILALAPAPPLGTKGSITYGTGLVYILFLGGNTFGFLVSVQMIIYLTKKIQEGKLFDKQYFFGLIVLSMMAMVLTYFCFTLSLLITSTGGAVATVLHVLPLMIAVFLLLIQRWLVAVLLFFLEKALSILGHLRKLFRQLF